MDKTTFKRAVKICGSQSALALRLDITRQYVSLIKLGLRNPKKLIKKIAEIAEEG